MTCNLLNPPGNSTQIKVSNKLDFLRREADPECIIGTTHIAIYKSAYPKALDKSTAQEKK